MSELGVSFWRLYITGRASTVEQSAGYIILIIHCLYLRRSYIDTMGIQLITHLMLCKQRPKVR